VKRLLADEPYAFPRFHHLAEPSPVSATLRLRDDEIEGPAHGLCSWKAEYALCAWIPEADDAFDPRK
jgi:hypothetical protein